MAHNYAISLDTLHPDDRATLGIADSENEPNRRQSRALMEQAGYWVPPKGILDQLTDRQRERLMTGLKVTWRG